MKKQILVAILLAVVMLNFNCKKSPTGPSESLSLSVEDVSCTEAWVRITSPGYQTQNTLTLYVNNEPNQSITLGNLDTVLTVESLLPNKSYTFKAQLTANNTKAVSNTAQATTLDTTSHNVTWQTFTFGEYNPSVLYDVAVIDENNIWAVGEIYMNDSLGKPDYNAYNAVHWDGTGWKFFKLQFFDFCGNTSTGSYPAKSVLAFSPTNIVISSGSQITWFNGQRQIKTECILASVNKMWGTSSSDLYIVGNVGNVAHYDGKNWQKIESGTDVRLTDIYGTPDGKNIWCCGWDYNTSIDVILEIKNNKAEILYHPTEHYLPAYGLADINSLWSSGSEFILAGGLVYRHSVYNKQQARAEFIPTTNGSALFRLGAFAWAVRGSNKNNVFIGGDNGMVWHYNGKSWYKYPELYNEEFDRRIFGLQVKPNIVAAVGWKNSYAWIIIGKK
ncbi:MAG: glucosyl transferase [Ignavibacteriaceae bacterium]|jgi:hypothetical protein